MKNKGNHIIRESYNEPKVQTLMKGEENVLGVGRCKG